MKSFKCSGVSLIVLFSLNGIMGQQQGQQSPFGNFFSFPFPSVFVPQSSPNNNPSSTAPSPYIFQQYFGTINPNPSSSPSSGNIQQQQQTSNPVNTYQGFSSWPFGGNGANGGLFNPFQNLFGNFQPTPNNQYVNQQGQQSQNPSQQQTNQNQYPFGFPFANPFFPQYNQQNQNQYQTPNQQPVQVPSSSGLTPNTVPNNLPTPNQGQGGIISPPNNNRIPPADTNVQPQPVELEVVHSKQDTKHPSLVLATPSPPNPVILEQRPEQPEENMNIDEFPLNPDQQNLPPEIVDVRFEEGIKGKSNNKARAKPSADGALLFE